jgi:hypothetical protein
MAGEVESFKAIMESASSEVRAPEAPQQQISFSGELGAMFREGLKDLQNAILPAFPESQRGVEEPGTPLVPTQSMVTEQVTLKDIIEAPTPPMTPTVERDNGREM